MGVQERKKVAFAKLRDLQGTPLAILFAMLIERKPVTKRFLSMVLQRDKDTIGRAVDFLEYEGHIKRVHYRAWALPSGQLTLPGFEIGLLNTPRPALPAERQALPSGDGQMGNESRNPKKSDFEIRNSRISGTTTTVVDTVEEKKVVGSTVTSERGKNPFSDIRDAGAESNDEIKATLKKIRINGRAIGRNMWPKIQACEHVTSHYLGAMAALVNQHPKPKYRNAGFFVHCVLAGDPAPEWCEECDGLHGEHDSGCSQWVNPYLRGCVEVDLNAIEDVCFRRAKTDVETEDAQERGDDGEDDEPGVRLAGMKPREVWQAALGELRLQMTRDTFNTWLKPARFVSYEDDTFVIGVENGYIKDWLSNRLLVTIQRTLTSVVGKPAEVKFVSEDKV